jgi:transposase-like protein
MPKKKPTVKSFNRAGLIVQSGKFDLEKVLVELLNLGQINYETRISFTFATLREIALSINISVPNRSVAELLSPYLRQQVVIVEGKGKGVIVHVSPEWKWYGRVADEMSVYSHAYSKAVREYYEISDSLRNNATYSTKVETAEIREEVRALQKEMQIMKQSIAEMFRTGKTPPDDVTVGGIEYHVNSRLEVRAKAPELRSTIVDDYPDENPF